MFGLFTKAGKAYQRKQSTAFTPKKARRLVTNIHSPFRTNFQDSETFKNYLHIFSSYLEVIF